MYWKRATYSWAFQAAAFGGLAISSKDGSAYPAFVMIFSILGAVTALSAFLTAKGSKFWQENWEYHVKFLESEVEGNLTKLVLAKDGVKFSVSRVNERLLLSLVIAWLLAFFAAAVCLTFPSVMNLPPTQIACLQVLCCSLLLAGGVLIVSYRVRSEIDATLVETLSDEVSG